MSYTITNDLQILQTINSENIFKEKTVLVTGAAGFLGSWITDYNMVTSSNEKSSLTF